MFLMVKRTALKHEISTHYAFRFIILLNFLLVAKHKALPKMFYFLCVQCQLGK